MILGQPRPRCHAKWDWNACPTKSFEAPVIQRIVKTILDEQSERWNLVTIDCTRFQILSQVINGATISKPIAYAVLSKSYLVRVHFATSKRDSMAL
jgi:hypothetical protein